MTPARLSDEALFGRAIRRPCPRCGAGRGSQCFELVPMPKHYNVTAMYCKPLEVPHDERSP